MNSIANRAGLKTHPDSPILLAFILCAAFLLRITGIHFGLPHIYHQDEPILVNHALALGTGDLNPHFFVIPPFTIYLLFGLYVLYFGFGYLTGQFSDKMDFAMQFLSDPSIIYLIGRFALGVLFGTMTVVLLYHLGRRFFSGQTVNKL